MFKLMDLNLKIIGGWMKMPGFNVGDILPLQCSFQSTDLDFIYKLSSCLNLDKLDQLFSEKI